MLDTTLIRDALDSYDPDADPSAIAEVRLKVCQETHYGGVSTRNSLVMRDGDEFSEKDLFEELRDLFVGVEDDVDAEAVWDTIDEEVKAAAAKGEFKITLNGADLAEIMKRPQGERTVPWETDDEQ